MKENKIYYPLTHPQKGIWYTEKFYPDTGISNIAGTLTFTNGVDYPILQKAINMFIKNNDGMRLKVLEDAFGAHQFVNDHEDKDFVFKDFSAKGGWEGLLEWINLECKIPINPINSDLYVFVIIKISDNEGGFFVKAHHAIVDAWTMILIGNQISDYYFKIKEGNTAEINQLPSYLDYIKTESDYEKSPEFLESRAFWLNKFNTIPKITTLKPSKPLFASCEAARKTFAFSKELTCRLEQYSEKSSISIFVILLSIMVIYLHRVLNKDDIVIGTPLFNRPTMKEKLTIGMFIETIPVFLHIDNQLDFGTFIRQTSVEWKQMRRHRYPYSLLLEEIRKNQKLTSNLYDIMFDYQNVKFDLAQSIKPRAYFSGSEANSLCIHISDRENIGQLYFDIDYQVDLFNDLEIEKIFSHFSTILQDALESPSKKIYELEIIEATEKNYLLKELNDTSMVFDREKTIHQLFEEQAEKTPHNFAVIFENKKLTYKQLNNHANNLANILRSKGIGPGDIVGLLGSRSIELGALILGILKAGAAFLLLDPNYPLNRINLILQDSGSKLLLTQANLNKGLFYSPVINIEDIPIDGPGNANPTNNNKPSDLAYIIYTSGSTGKPKGVMIEHKSMCSFFAAMAKQLNLAGKIVLSVTTVTFDIFMFEILLPLVNGLTVVIANEEQQLVPMSLNNLIIDQGINIIQTTPSRMNLLLMDKGSDVALRNITDIVLGGEVFPEILLKKLKSVSTARIFNGYGPSEATIYSSFKELTDNDHITIGQPVANTRIYILDDNLQPVPINVAGELFIGGEGLARGYLNNSDLTSEKFVPSPFEPGNLIYRTGDLAKWNFNGEIEFLGRMDFQVKIRGYRIELGEIENALREHGKVLDVIVMEQEAANEDKYLSAFIVSETNIPVSELRSFLAKSLPDYMVPASFVFIDEMPLSQNGKVDRNALKNLSYIAPTESDIPYIEPRNEVDSILVKSWVDILGAKKIGINDNFFDLGGDSLKIVRLLVTLMSFNWELTARDFYKYQTIRLLSDKIRGIAKDDRWEIEINNDIADVYCKHDTDKLIVSGPTDKISNVLLTGATGYLGVHLLRELDTLTENRIYCLVRGTSKHNATERLQQSLDFFFPNEFKNKLGRRIQIINADLTLEYFGLSKEEYNELGKKIDSVIHTAAKVSHYGNYSDFEQINIYGTKRLIDFCLAFNCKMHHISTTSISGRYLVRQNLDNTVFTENDFYIGQHYYENVYVRSKFEAENLIFNAMNNGLIASIYRVGMLSGRYSDGYFQLNIGDNGLYNRMKSVILLGAIPEEFLGIELEYTPVDYCSRAIVLLSRIVESENRVFHIFNHKTISVAQFINAAKLLGLEVEIKNKESFSKHLRDLFVDSTQTEALNGIINDLNLARTIGLQNSPLIDSRITCAYLNLVGFQWPEIDIPYLIKVINYMVSINFLTNNTDNVSNTQFIG